MTVTIPINTTPAPSRVDTPNFAVRADAYHAWLPGAVAAMNAQNVENNTLTTAAQVASAAAVAASAVVTATNPITNAAAAAASATAAAASASATSTAAASAAAAKDLALAAWAASTAPAEQLAGIGKMLHGGAVVKSIIYDTSKDFDGGEWRKRCSDKSWYTEALGGSRWIGRQPSEATARAYVASLANPELVTNGTFATDTSGWVGGVATLSVVAGGIRVTGTGAGPNATQATPITTVVGKTYYITATLTTANAASKNSFLYVGTTSGGSNLLNLTMGSVSGVTTYGSFVATTTTTFVTVSGGSNWVSGEYADFDNISVKLADVSVDTSGAMYQLTADNKFYRLNGNLLPDTTLFNVGWATDTSATRTVVSVLTPDGGVSGVQLSSLSNAVPYVYANPVVTSGLTYTYSAYIKLGTGGDGTVRLDNTTRAAAAAFNLNTGAVSTATNCTSSILALGGGWFRCSMTYTATSSAANTHDIVLLGTFLTGQGHYIWGAQLELGTVATAYKAVTGSAVSSATEVFRGVTREFPALVAVVAETARVVIYDLTQASCPMWMVFTNGIGGYFAASNNSLSAANGTLAVAQNDRTVLVYFTADRGSRTHATASNYYITNIANRNGTLVMGQVLYTTYLPAGTNNDVSLTTLENAPTDPYTGLPTPTIAVATAGGVSVIKQDGTVLNSLNTERVDSVGFVGSTLFMGNRYATTDTFRFQELSSIAASWAPTSGMGYLFSGGAEDQSQIIPAAPYIFHRIDSAFTLNKLNKAFPSKSMRARVTNAYNTGWQVGDSRLAALASTTAETITDGSGTELVTNGTFATDTSGWTSGNSTLSVVSGAMRVTIAAGGSSGTAFQLITGLLVGRTYTVSLTFATGTSFAASISLGPGGVNGADYAYSGLAAGVNTLSFTATAANLGITLSNDGGSTGQYNDFDNISCKVTSEMINNGTFTTDTSGWTVLNGATFVQSGGAGLLTIAASQTFGAAYQAISCVVGRSYFVGITITPGTAANATLRVSNSTANAGEVVNSQTSASGRLTASFIATQTTHYLGLLNGGTATQTTAFDNISVKLAEPDRSVKNNGLVLNGTLTKTAVASGANLAAYSGFSASNYLEQPYSANLDFGTGDFCVMGWVTPSSLSSLGYLFGRQNTTPSGSRIYAYIAASTGVVNFTTTDGTTSVPISGGAVTVGSPAFIACMKSGASVYLYVNAVQVATATAATLTMNNATALFRLGVDHAAGNPALASLALWRISATAPSADQIAHIYRTELPLFQAGAQCTIAGTSTSVTALSYDEGTDTAHVGTSWGRSGFRDLLRVESEATTSSTLSSLSSVDGVVLTGSTTSGYVSAPSMYLRDEIRRKGTASKALAKQLIWQEFYATAGQTVFTLAKNGDVRAVYVNGIVRKSPADYSVSSDGFQNIITFTSGISAGIQVSVQTTRS